MISITRSYFIPHIRRLKSNVNSKVSHLKLGRFLPYTSDFLRSKGFSKHFFSTAPPHSSELSLTMDPQGNDYLFGDSERRKTFADLGLSDKMCSLLSQDGKSIATSIQQQSIPMILSGRDCVIAAETGSGKTLSYMIPILEKLINASEEDKAAENVYYPSTVILVPTKDLCHQVAKMTQSLIKHLDPENDRQISIDVVSGTTSDWPFYGRNHSPDIVVATPAFMANFVKGPAILDEDLFRLVKCIVLDEADMLLDGSYKRHVEQVMDAFKVTRRNMIREEILDINSKILQVILSAATIPTSGELSIEKYVKKKFPTAYRISNTHLHKHHPRISQSFVKTRNTDLFDEDFIGQVVDAIKGSKELIGDTVHDPTMIFANTAEDATKLAVLLRETGIDCAEFHKRLLPDERENNIAGFRNGTIRALVCTDHAARGLDLPFVRHVIQAQFASNVVQHLHRVGRASRAGSLGKATNFYCEASSNLVNAIASDKSDNVDQSFSRRRGFRNKLKRATSLHETTTKMNEGERDNDMRDNEGK